MYAVTDFTDTIMVKMFVRNEQLPDILADVKKGAFLKIKGVTTIDKFDGELTIGSITGIRKINDFTESRKDTAPEKMCIRDRFKNDSISSITVSGIRCQDMRLRMKYVDIPTVLEADVEKAVRGRIEDGCGNLYVLVNYTALFSTRNVLKRLEGEKCRSL